jgi:hypothetical protein
MIIALHHTGIATRDLDRLSNFYMKLFSGLASRAVAAGSS